MSSGLSEVRGGRGIKDRQISSTAGIRKHKLALNDRYFYDNFKGRPLCAKSDGAGAATGTAADLNLCNTGKNIFEYFIIGIQTVVALVIGVGGLDIKLDDGAAGAERGRAMPTLNVHPTRAGRQRHTARIAVLWRLMAAKARAHGMPVIEGEALSILAEAQADVSIRGGRLCCC